MLFIEASRIVLSQKKYIVGWLCAATGFFLLFLSIPVGIVPGNSFGFQLSLLSFREYMLLGSLALVSALSFVMQWFLWKRRRELKKTARALGAGGAGGFSAIVASMFGTASCASCISALFGFLGIGTVFTLIDLRNYIVAFSFLLLFISLYFSSQRIVSKCISCDTK